MLPIIFIIIAAIFVYRTARDNGYNAVLWTIIAIVGFAGIQIAIGLFAGILMGIGIAIWGWPPTLLEDYASRRPGFARAVDRLRADYP